MATTNLPPKQRSVGNKLVAVVLWSLSSYTTYQFLVGLAGDTPQVLLITIIAQAALTFAESPLWRGDVRSVAVIALALDTFANIGGLYFYIGNLENTASWQAFTATFGGSGQVSGFTQLFLSLVVGALLAAAPEALWRQS
jgi:Na+/H+ antiporter NhaD/arsenite permease-like protein